MRAAHLIRPLVSDGIPERHVIFDTEAGRESTAGGERQTFALAAAEYLRVGRTSTPEVVAAEAYSDPRELWADVAAFTRAKHRTLVWCHGLAYDLRVSRALAILPELGFELAGIVLDYTSAWASFRGNGRTLLLCDLTSWLPVTLKTLGRDLGVAQHPKVPASAPLARHLERCVRDVQITREAVLQLVGLVASEQLGPWRATGAGQSHAAWRRRFLHTSPLCHDDQQALDAERRAMWTGRCEAWRWGKVTGAGAAEYDLQLAYPDIAAGELTPETLLGRMHGSALAWLLADQPHRALLAEVTVTTEQPLVPCSDGKLIHWPVGTFETTLWDPELRLLIEHGAKVRIRRAWCYRRGPALQPFSRWLLAAVTGEGGERTTLQRRALKHWSRAFVGRFGLRYRSWEPHSRMPSSQLRLGELHDLDTGEHIETLQVGHSFMTLAGHALAEDAAPQITGWVMSECRRRLWQLCELAGLREVHYMDTDSVIVTAAGARLLEDAIRRGEAHSLRLKSRHRNLTIHGPRQLQLGARRRVAGVPTEAVEVAPGEYVGEVFSGLRESLAAGDGQAVMVHRRRFQLEHLDTRRDHLPGGATAPHTVG